MSNFYFDLEFIRTTNTRLIKEVADGVTIPATFKIKESIAAWHKDTKPELVKKALDKILFDPSFGEIVSFSAALDDGEIFNTFRTNEITEKELLEKVNEILSITLLKKHGTYESKSTAVWTGHNICECDLLYLWKRMVINQVRPCVKIPHQAKQWSLDVCDLRYEWGMKGRSSMDFIMKALGMGSKGDFTGADVGDAWLNGEYKKIADYNIEEINQLREIHKRLNFKG